MLRAVSSVCHACSHSHSTPFTGTYSEVQSEPVEDDELEKDVDDEGEQEDVEGDPEIDVEHDDEGVVDDKDVIEEDIEDELIDVRILLIDCDDVAQRQSG